VNYVDDNQDSITITFFSYVFENISCLDSNEDDNCETNDNTNVRSSVSFKEHKKLQKENALLRKQKTSFENEVKFMKNNFVRKYRYYYIDVLIMFLILS
jgi:hypothetical protein